MYYVIRYGGRVKVVQTVQWALEGVYVRSVRQGVGASVIFLTRAAYDRMILPSATVRLHRKLDSA